jgi:hypothetical protein
MGLNGMTASDFRRYFVQWVTEHNPKVGGAAQLRVLGYCVRDKGTHNWVTVFEHESHDVCEKVANILNEGEGNGLSK